MNRDSRTANIVLLGLGATALVLLSLPVTRPVRELSAVVSYLLEPLPYHGDRLAERLEGVPEGAARIIDEDVALRDARRRLEEAQVVKAENAALRAENERLSKELGLKPQAGHALCWARVLERDPQNWYRSLMIDAGQEQGIGLNAPVLGLEDGRLGVVGRVVEVNPRTSKVLLLTDELSAAAAYLPARGWEGLVQGEGTAVLRMNYLPVDARFAVGDEVDTSPTSASFPPGLPIGHVSRVSARDTFQAFQSVEVARDVAAAKLREVMVMVPVPASAAAAGAGQAAGQ